MMKTLALKKVENSIDSLLFEKQHVYISFLFSDFVQKMTNTPELLQESPRIIKAKIEQL